MQKRIDRALSPPTSNPPQNESDGLYIHSVATKRHQGPHSLPQNESDALHVHSVARKKAPHRCVGPFFVVPTGIEPVFKV